MVAGSQIVAKEVKARKDLDVIVARAAPRDDATHQAKRGASNRLLGGAASQRLEEFIHGETCGPDNGSQRASIQLPVVRHNHLGKGIISPRDDVGSLLLCNAVMYT